MSKDHALRIAQLKLAVMRRHGFCRHLTRESMARSVAVAAPGLASQQVLDLVHEIEVKHGH